jgi:hypothetical protein
LGFTLLWVQCVFHRHLVFILDQKCGWKIMFNKTLIKIPLTSTKCCSKFVGKEHRHIRVEGKLLQMRHPSSNNFMEGSKCGRNYYNGRNDHWWIIKIGIWVDKLWY